MSSPGRKPVGGYKRPRDTFQQDSDLKHTARATMERARSKQPCDRMAQSKCRWQGNYELEARLVNV